MKIGLIQGRLLPPVDGHIQEFPRRWQEEFKIAEELGFGHIEWIITSRSFKDNPIFFEDCKKYNISSLCADNLVSDHFLDDIFLRDNLDPICAAAEKNNIHWLTIPLLEESNISDDKKREIFKAKINEYSNRYPYLNFSFEAEAKPEDILDIVEERENFWITYDTGNITSEGLDHRDYILKTHKKINNVHLKDRTFDAQTVPPLSGDTDFDLIFNILSEVKYTGPYTIQTARGESGLETKTMKQHKSIFERIYNATHS